MISRLDRYIARTFALPLVLCTVAVLGLYVVIDLFSNLGSFLDQPTLGRVARMALTYYATFAPLFLAQVMPTVILLAALMALIRLARHNEISTLKACGISFQRTLVPLFVVSGALSLVLLLDQEYLVPSLARRMQELKVRVTDSNRTVYQDLYMVDLQRRVFLIDSFHSRDSNEPLRGIYMVSHERPDEFVFARTGRWLDGQLVLRDVVRSTEPLPGEGGMLPMEAPELLESEIRLTSSLTPQQLKHNKLELEFFPIPRLLEIGRLFPHMRAHMRLEVHRRLAFCVANVVLLLVAIPFAFQQEGRSAMLAIAVALAVALAYYLLVMLCSYLARGPDAVLSPAVAGWLPLLSFAALGVWLFRNLPT